MSKYLVTSALPYANGRLHIGHLAGAYLPADIYVKFLKICQQDVIYICGTDEHGAPISIRAESEKKKPQEIVKYFHKNILDSFTSVDINFDNFSGTSREEHHKLSQEFFLVLYENGKINTKVSKQTYCTHDKRFLPDRYIEGECPYCHAGGARGDQCDSCGKLIDATLLINPKCNICGNNPIIKETQHWYLDLPAFSDQLKKWLDTKKNWKDNVKKFILNWIDEGLIERAITRDIDWGVPVPLNDSKDKVLYVWFDAPIGYISSTIEWGINNGKPDIWKDYWLDPSTNLVHFIGKDNIPFHAIIWPAILMGQNKEYTLPSEIPANEYLNLEGEKISTSRDFAVWVEDFVKDFDSDLLRYVLAVNAPESKDADFSWKDFQAHVNNSLANVMGNFANRVFAFAKKNFCSILKKPSVNNPLISAALIKEIYKNYTEFKVRKVVKLVMDLARDGNKLFNDAEPWATIKNDVQSTQNIIFFCADLLRIFSIIFYPILPKSMRNLRKMMSLSDETIYWIDIFNVPEQIIIGDFEPLFKKVEDKEIERQIELLKQHQKK